MPRLRHAGSNQATVGACLYLCAATGWQHTTRDYDPATDGGDVFIRSLYFKDPNGTLLEFACWTTTFDESDVEHAPARSSRTAAVAGV